MNDVESLDELDQKKRRRHKRIVKCRPRKKKRHCVLKSKKKRKKIIVRTIINNPPPDVTNIAPSPVTVNPTVNVDSTLAVAPFRRLCNRAHIGTFANPNSIDIADPSADPRAVPYPSTITVSGLEGFITKVTVNLLDLSGNNFDAREILLAGPDGITNTLLTSDAGGMLGFAHVFLTFDDSAAGPIPDDGPLVSGTYQPTNYEEIENLNSPAPPTSPVVALSNFNGLAPNGVWSLYVTSDSPIGGAFVIQEGWTITITTTEPEDCTFTPL